MSKIRSPHIAAEVDDSVATGNDRRQARSEVLARHLVSSLSVPNVHLTGARLPNVGRVFEAGEPGTNLPDDDYPALIEALLQEFTFRGDTGAMLFGRSGVAPAMARRMGRKMPIYDPYADSVQGDGSHNTLGRPQHHFDQGSLEILHVHLPAPGLVDRAHLLYRDGDSPPERLLVWEGLPLDRFLTALKVLLSRWIPHLSANGVLSIQSGVAEFGDARRRRPQRIQLYPFVNQIVTGLDLGLIRAHPIRFELGQLPIVEPALERGWLHVFSRAGGSR